MRSAEIRYLSFIWASAPVISDCNADISIRSSLLSHACAAMLNAAACRASRMAHRRSRPTGSASMEHSNIISENNYPLCGMDLHILCTCDPEDLMQTAKRCAQYMSSVLRSSELIKEASSSNAVYYAMDEIVFDLKLSLIQETLGR